MGLIKCEINYTISSSLILIVPFFFIRAFFVNQQGMMCHDVNSNYFKSSIFKFEEFDGCVQTL